jgi:uncharacterized protein (DUF305 family)
MSKTIRVFKGVLVALVPGLFLLAGCAKEQMRNGENVLQQQGMMGTAGRSVAGKEKNDADKAFDREMKKLMHEMMRQMNKMKMTCEPDVDFAKMMIMHHDMGIKMADLELRYGHEPKGKELAQKTKVGNQASKQRLQSFLNSHTNWKTLPKDQCRRFMMEMDESMKMMMKAMQHAPDTDDVDVDFAQLMIIHHQGAIDMSRVELKWGHEEAARSEAQMIIDEQSKEIGELKDFINAHG